MTRGKLILTIWEFGMDHPNFSLFELKEFLESKQFSEDDINFGSAYVEKNFIKSKDLDEYLIDQNSITGFLTHKQNKIAGWAMFIAIVSLIVTILLKGSVWRHHCADRYAIPQIHTEFRECNPQIRYEFSDYINKIRIFAP